MSEQNFSSYPSQPYGSSPEMSLPFTGETPSAGGTGDVAREQPGQVAATAKEQASAVTSTAVAGGQQVAAHAKEQLGQVSGELRDQIQGLVRQFQSEIRHQASSQTTRAAATLRTLAEQMTALADGRTEEAGQLVDYVRQSGHKLRRHANRLDQGGFDTVVNDVRGFARRRPGLFLLSAAAAGFAAGRLVRGVQATNDDSGDDRGVAASALAALPRPAAGPVTPDRAPSTASAESAWPGYPPNEVGHGTLDVSAPGRPVP